MRCTFVMALRLSRHAVAQPFRLPRTSPRPVQSSRAYCSDSQVDITPNWSFVWGLPPAAPICTHAVFGDPQQLAPLATLKQLELHPANLTKPALTEFLQSQLKSRAAVQQAVHAVVLSGPYLPSQLCIIDELAASLQLETSRFISSQQLHILVSRPSLEPQSSSAQQQQQQQQRWADLLTSSHEGFSKPLPLSQKQMDSAWDVEQALNRQLRLFSAPAWNDALQLQLLSRKAVRSCLAVRSLMGQSGLAAVRKMVEKQGLHLLEISYVRHEAELQENPCKDMLNSGSRRRTRAGSNRNATTAAAADVHLSAAAGRVVELVLLVSRVPVTAEEAADMLSPEAFTDYVYQSSHDSMGSTGGSSSSVNSNDWVATFMRAAKFVKPACQ